MYVLSQTELAEFEERIAQITAEKERALQRATEDIALLNEKLTRANDEINQYKAQLAKYKDLTIAVKKDQSFDCILDGNLKSAQADDKSIRVQPVIGEVENKIAAAVRFVLVHSVHFMLLLYICDQICIAI